MKDQSFFRERIITVVMLGLACYFSVSTCIHKQAQNNLLTTIVERKTDTIRIKTDTIIYLKDIVRTENFFQHNTETILRDSIKIYKGLLAESDIKAADATQKEIPIKKDEIIVPKKELDSLKRLAYVYKDKYLNISLFPSDSITRDSIFFNYDVQLTAKNYRKREHWYNESKSYTDVSSLDPRVTIMGDTIYTIQHLQPDYGLRLHAALEYNFLRRTLGAGIGARYDFGKDGKLHLLTTFFYNINTGKIEPVTNLRYDFITF